MSSSIGFSYDIDVFGFSEIFSTFRAFIEVDN